MSKPWRYFLLFLLLAILLVCVAIVFKPDGRVHVVFCDVGQGDGILIYKGNTQILVDGGPDSSVLSCLGRHMPFYDRTVEFVVLTNPDLDHYGGLMDVLERYKVLSFGGSGVVKDDSTFERMESLIKKEGLIVEQLVANEKLAADGIEGSIVWPPEEKVLGISNTPMEGQEVNERSIVFKLTYGSFDVLLTGDIVPPGTDQLAQEYSGSVEVLKVPHHGSKNGLTKELVEKTKPQFAVISAGRGNRFGHPHEETLNILKEASVTTLGTYEKGEIEIVTDGQDYAIKTER